MTFTVARIETDTRDDHWAVQFSDGVTLHIAKSADPAHIDAMVADHAERGEPDHHARIVAMVTAVREHEGQANAATR